MKIRCARHPMTAGWLTAWLLLNCAAYAGAAASGESVADDAAILLDEIEAGRLAQESRIRDLRQQAEALEESRRELAERGAHNAKVEMDAARRRREIMMRRVEKIAADADDLEKTALQLERQLFDEKARHAKLQDQYLEMEKLRLRVADQERANQELEKEITTRADAVAELERHAQSLRRELDNAHHESAELERRLKDMRQVERALKNARAEYCAAENRAQALLAGRAALLSEIDDLRGKIIPIFEQTRAVAEELADYGKMRTELKNLDAMRAELEMRADNGETEEHAARAELRQLARQVAVLEKAACNLNDQTALLRRAAAESAAERKQRVILEERVRMLESMRVADAAAAPAAVPPAPGRPSVAVAPSGQDLAAVEQKLIAEARRSADLSASGGAAAVPPPMTPAQLKADEHYRVAIERWDADDVDGAIIEFKQALRHNKEAAGAYYNLGVAYARKGDTSRACRYACDAGLCYLRHGNRNQALRMLVFIQNLDAASKLAGKLRDAISAAAPE